MSRGDGSLSDRIRALSPEKRRALEQALAARRAQASGEGARAESAPAEPGAAGNGPAGLSSAQRRMWYLDRRDPGRAAYNVPLAVRLRGPADPDCVRRALVWVMERHDPLRTRYGEAGGDVEAIVEPPDPDWRVVDLSDRAEADALGAVDAQAAADGLAPVDLGVGVLRATLYKVAPDDWILHLVVHHIAIDGWSAGVLMRELEHAFDAFAAGGAPTLPRPGARYADYVREEEAGLAGERAAAATAFWTGALADAPDGVALPATADGGQGGDAVGTLPFGIDEPDYSAFKAFCRSQRISLFVGFLAILKLVLSRYARAADLVIGTEASARPRAEHADLIGLFVNQLALRTDMSGDPGLADACRRVSAVVRRAFAHQDLPFDRVVRALGRQGERQPLFNVVLSLRTQERAGGADGAPRAVRFEALPDGGPKTFAPKFDLVFSMVDDGARLGGAIEYDRRLYADEAVAGLAEAVGRAVALGLEDPARAFGSVSLGGDTIEALERGAWNATRRALPGTVGLHRFFEAAHDRDPEHPALVHGSDVWSHARLERAANRLAHRLAAAGAGPERVVACCLSRGPSLIAAALGVLKSGAALLVLDPEQASRRWARILDDARPAVILADAAGAGVLPAVDVPVLNVDEPGAGDETRPAVDIDGAQAAYVIYTSGSTGRPKGVVGHHRGLTALSDAQVAAFGLTPLDRVMQVSAITFDAFVWELALVWRAGATLVLHPDGAPRPDAGFVDLLRAQRVSMMTIPPSVLDALPPADLPDLKTLVVAGEACPAALTRRFAAGRSMINAYGPTETTVWASAEPCAPGAAPPIGRPIANMRLHVVDEALHPVPVGAVGEIALAGPAVTRGYLGRPDLTAERFRPNPFASAPGERLYLTGDLGCRLADGRVRYLGRIDDQLKIRGFRVEPGEAQAVIARHPGVGLAVVQALAQDGRDRLVAWWTPGAEPVDEAALRAHAAAHLPSYLRPSAYVRLQAMPLTPHGKVDRRALPPPDWSARSAAGAGEPPRDGMERRLAAVWAEVLGIDRFGRDDNFFELGGDSILSVRLVSRARAAGLAFTAAQLFAYPTVASLAPLVQGTAPDGGAAAANEDGELPLSPLQEGLLFHCLRRPDLPLYVQRFRLRVSGPLDPDALERAWNRLIARHQALRTRIVWRGRERPVQAVEAHARLRVRRLDLSRLAPAEREAALDRLDREEGDRVFDLESAPLLRCAVARLGAESWEVFWACHHVMVDGWSFAVIERDLFAFYAAERDGRTPPASVAPAFADHLAWIARQDHAAARDWWRRRLSGFETPALVSDGGDGAVGASDAAEPVWSEVSELLEPAADRRLRAFASSRGLTLNTVVQVAWALVLSRHLRRRDVLTGMIVSGRPAELPGVEEIVGLFINTLPCRFALDPHEAVADVLAAAQRDLAEMQARSFLSLAELQRLADVPAGAAPFDTLVVVQTLPPGGARPAELSVTADPVAARTDYPLTVIVEAAGRTALRFVHDSSRLGAARTRALAAALRAALEALPASAEGPLGAWPARLDVDAERAVAALPTHGARWADPAALVSARAAAAPDAAALVLEGETRSYAALEANANRLAHWLRAEGVGPETVVALHLDRSFALVEAMLAVMKAGGAFLPLGLETPAPRLAGMLEEARPRLVLTASSLAGALAPALSADGPAVVALDGPSPPWAGAPASPPDPIGAPDDPVYVFYTSGSTGRPKGVVNTRRGLANRVAWGQHAYPLGPDDRVMQKTPYTFDVSVWEWLWPLTVGATLVIARPDGHRDPSYLAALAEREGVTLMHFVPSMLQLFLEDPARAGRCRSLRRIVCSGEAVSGALRDRCRALAGVEILNLYGPTEAAIEVSHWACAPGQAGASVPMGWPIDGVVLRVVDPDGHPCPPGVPGELLIGGVAVARGYVARPGLTAERFVPDPLAGRDGVTEPGARVYRTGDLAAWRPDGALDYLGRLDWQVKIRGQRVELAEIEAVLRTCAGVRDCAVVFRKGDGRLIAYVAGPGDDPAAIGALKARVAERLPEVMRPGEWVMLEALPLTASGKLDRAALPEPGGRARIGGRGGAPADPLSREVAAILLDVLGAADGDAHAIGVRDHFTADLGGHSLQVLRAVGRLERRWPGRVDLAGFLRDPTVAGVTRLISLGSVRGAAAAVSPLLVPLRPDGEGPPLFLIHPALGSVICYIEAARAFPGARPLLAIQAPELAGAGEAPGEDLVALAARYRAAARGVQPEGRLALAGYSYGGLVAFEMARQEAASGVPPALLAVLDTLAPPADPSRDGGPDEAALLAELGTVLQRYGGGAPTLTAEAVAAIPAGDRLAFVRRTLEKGGALDGLAAALDLQATLEATRSAARARAFYRPGPYEGPLALARCAAPSPEDAAGADPAQIADVAFGWTRWVTGEIAVETVPGDHVDLLRGANAGRVAAWLGRMASR
ncbi:amino acid adenylation domain-containing protein [Salinarimonas sp.]|uniref:amino acid adenylation domain-containing protein n=1 Tax=Salinarimonas sp. TaxID=2766526 RepID=UPI0032D94EA2